MQNAQIASGSLYGAYPERFWVVLLALLLFGLVYNLVIDHVHRKGYNDGFVWLEVVVGVSATLFASGFVIGWLNVARLFILFAASGFFMAFGDIRRFVIARRVESKGE